MCTSIMCGRVATQGRTTLLSRNEDFDINNWNKYMKYRKEPPFSKDDTDWILGNGLKVPVPKIWNKYCAMADADGQTEASVNIRDHFFFEERGINENNVAISATNSMQINDAVLAVDPNVPCGIEESVIGTLILPQVRSARDGVLLLGKYVSTYGASEAAGIQFADENDVWYMEICSGHHWTAVRIPDNAYLVVANSMRIHDIDLDDSENVLCSEGIFEFVYENGLLENPRRHCFDLASAFGHPYTVINGVKDNNYNIDRIWLGQSILTPSLKQRVRQEVYPLFLKPDKPIKISDIRNVLRSTFRGTKLEGYSDATRPIGVVRTTESHILTIDAEMQNQLKGVVWQAIGSPLGSAYVPFYALNDRIPESYEKGTSQAYNDKSVYWAWKTLFAIHDSMGQIGKQNLYRDKWDEYFEKYHAKVNSAIKVMATSDYRNAVKCAKMYSYGNLSMMADNVMEQCKKAIAEMVAGQKDK